MWDKSFYRAPPALCVLAVLTFLGLLLSRAASTKEGHPAFFPLDRGNTYVEVNAVGLASGIYQFSDSMTPLDVMKLTGKQFLDVTLNGDPLWMQPLRNGESVNMSINDHKIATLERGWMAASNRIVMAIPLHPDRMSRQDWEVLPGVSEVLADRIEIDRHKNGDFLSLKALDRVKGIGTKRIESWIDFFEEG